MNEADCPVYASVDSNDTAGAGLNENIESFGIAEFELKICDDPGCRKPAAIVTEHTENTEDNENNNTNTTGITFDTSPINANATNAAIREINDNAAVGTTLDSSPINADATNAAIREINDNAALTSNKRKRSKSLPFAKNTKLPERKSYDRSKKIKIGCRVSIKKNTLYKNLESDDQKKSLDELKDSHRVYGTVISSSRYYIKGYSVSFDRFPDHAKTAEVKGNCLRIAVLGEEEAIKQDDEKVLNCPSQLSEAVLNPINAHEYNKSIEAFCRLDILMLLNASTFDMKYGTSKGDVIKWTTLKSNKYIRKEEDPMTYPDKLELRTRKETKGLNNMSETFFHDFMPSLVEGHAKRMDEYLSDPRASYYLSVRSGKMIFHRPTEPDPDWIIKNCYLLLLAAALEVEMGVDNLWKTGNSGSFHPNANFGNWVPVHYFRVFQSCAQFMFCNKENWYQETGEYGWKIFQPCLDSFNMKRRSLFEVILLALDGTNVKYENYYIGLGTQLYGGVECFSGVLAYQDILLNSGNQKRKKYYYSDAENRKMETFLIPQNSRMHARTSEVLRQVEGAGVKRGGWCCEDANFGSVVTAIELKKRLGIYSTFIVEDSKDLFPMEPLRSILKARYGKQWMGHWVVMKTIIAGVEILAIA